PVVARVVAQTELDVVRVALAPQCQPADEAGPVTDGVAHLGRADQVVAGAERVLRREPAGMPGRAEAAARAARGPRAHPVAAGHLRVAAACARLLPRTGVQRSQIHAVVGEALVDRGGQLDARRAERGGDLRSEE